MTDRRFIQYNAALNDYLLENSHPESETLRSIREETETLPQGKMLSTHIQVSFMQFLIKLIGAKHVLEVGTFTGYTSLAMAEALPKDGTLVTCDKSVEYTNIAKKHWASAIDASKITLKMGPALETMQALANSEYQFDLVFIDANKGDYIEYYEFAMEMLAPNGLILIDNTLWGGSVVNDDDQSNITRKIRQVNRHVMADPRVTSHLLNIGDGLTLVKRV